MKIVHTADWHIGKTLRGKQRSEEYREVLAELKLFLEKEQIDLLLVAGDIFDSFSPSAEAEDIVYNFFHDISFLGTRTVVIAGNHDSGFRFEAIARLMALANVHMLGFYDAQLPERSRVIVPSRDGSQKADIIMLPFISERIFTRADDLTNRENEEIAHNYSQELGRVLKNLTSRFQAGNINIVMAHLLMHGAKPGGGERRLYLGDNYAVHPAEIPADIDYMGLGHIHLCQSIAAPCPLYYSGSPLQMDFGETEQNKGFLYLQAQPQKQNLPEFIPLTKGKQLREIKGTMEQINAIIESDKDLQDAYLKVTIQADATSLGLSHEIKKKLPNTVDIRREYISKGKQELALQTGDDWLPDLYQKFYESQHEHTVSEEIMADFKKLYADCLGSKDSH